VSAAFVGELWSTVAPRSRISSSAAKGQDACVMDVIGLFLGSVRGILALDRVMLAGIFPFTVRTSTVTHRRATARFWRWLAAVCQRRPSLVAKLIDWRHLTRVFVSMDPRYGPIYNPGVAEKLGRALVDHGYSLGRRAGHAHRVQRRRPGGTPAPHPTWRARPGQQ
jgi:hypothetical protein